MSITKTNWNYDSIPVCSHEWNKWHPPCPNKAITFEFLQIIYDNVMWCCIPFQLHQWMTTFHTYQWMTIFHTYEWMTIFHTYTFPGPVMEAHVVAVQYSDITPYIKLTWLKKEIAEKENHAVNKIIPWHLTSVWMTDTDNCHCYTCLQS